jgi:hypothetical protein
MKQGSKSRRVFLIHRPDARLRDKGEKTPPINAKENLQGDGRIFFLRVRRNKSGTTILSRMNDMPYIVGWDCTIVIYDSLLT